MALVITVGLQSAAQRLRPEWESLEGAVYRSQLELLERATEDSLILGDSRSLRALDPHQLGRELRDGSRWRNLSMNGLPPMGAHLVLRRWVERHGPPERVIFAVTPFLLADMQVFERMFVELFPLQPSEVPAVVSAPLPRKVKYTWLLASLFPTQRQNRSLRRHLETWVGHPPREERLRREIERTQQWLGSSGGWIPKTWGMEPGELARERRSWKRMEFEVLPIHDEYVEALCEQAAELGCPLLVVTPPVPEPLNRLRTKSGYNTAYGEWLSALLRRHPGLRVKEATVPAYPSDLFADPAHLRERGALQYTAEVAAWIRQLPGR